MMRCDLVRASACASVLAQTKSTPSSPEAIILLTAFPPAPPTPKTVMRGFNSWISGIARLMVMEGPMGRNDGAIVSRQFVNRTLTIHANRLTVMHYATASDRLIHPRLTLAGRVSSGSGAHAPGST